MEDLFNPVVQQVIRLVSQQVDHISHTKGKRINVDFSLAWRVNGAQRLTDDLAVYHPGRRFRKLGLPEVKTRRVVCQ